MTLKHNPEMFIGVPYNEEIFHCWTLIEVCLDVPTLQDVSVATVKGDIHKYKDLYVELDTPVDYSIALMGTHVGIYYQGGIYHADKPSVRWEPIRVMERKYTRIKYHTLKTPKD